MVCVCVCVREREFNCCMCQFFKCIVQVMYFVCGCDCSVYWPFLLFVLLFECIFWCLNVFFIDVCVRVCFSWPRTPQFHFSKDIIK